MGNEKLAETRQAKHAAALNSIATLKNAVTEVGMLANEIETGDKPPEDQVVGAPMEPLSTFLVNLSDTLAEIEKDLRSATQRIRSMVF